MANWLTATVARALELHRLDAGIHSRARSRGCEMVRHSDHRAVWSVRVPGQSSRYLSATSSGTDRERFAVHVDTELFYRTWLAGARSCGRRRIQQCVLRADMPRSDLYAGAVEDFAISREMAVPLPEVEAWLERSKVRLGVLGGAGRAFWLIANRAPAFPIAVRGHDAAELLHRYVGCSPAPLCFANLFTTHEVATERQRQGS